jgi:hypothetical protein
VSFLTGWGARLCGSPTAAVADNVDSESQAIETAVVAIKKETPVANHLVIVLNLVMASLCVVTDIWSTDAWIKIIFPAARSALPV